MKNRRIFITLFTLLCMTSLMTTSCNGELTEDYSGEASVSFNISLPGNEARSALPTVNFEKYLYEIKAKNQDDGTEKSLAQNLEVDNLSNQKFTMSRAKWIFCILAYEKNESTGEAEGDSVFEGESSVIDLVKSVYAQVTMPLRASTTGVGKVTIPLKYSTEGVKKITAGLYENPTGGDPIKILQTFTKESGITSTTDANGKTTYSITFSDDSVPSGKTYYARFVLYDENDVPVSYYTEAVYVVKGQESKPEVFLRDENGNVQTDENGNPKKNTEENAAQEIEPNLFAAEISAEKDKKVYAETTRADGTKIKYELKDEDGDGVYDTMLPPGNYEIKVGENYESSTSQEENLNVNTNGGIARTLKLKSAIVKTEHTSGVPRYGKKLSAVVTDSSDKITEEELKYQWYTAASLSATEKEWTKISGATEKEYTPLLSDIGKFIFVTVEYKKKPNGSVTGKTELALNKGIVEEDDFTISYEGAVLAGNYPQAEKIVLLDEEGNALPQNDGFTPSFSESLDPITSSAWITIYLDKEGYETYTENIFIPVLGRVLEEEEIPSLSTNKEKILLGYVQFILEEGQGTDLEYSADDGKTWKPVDGKQFPVEGDEVLIRRKEIGTPNEEAYIAPSDTVSISVTGFRGIQASAPLPEDVPELSTDKANISGGCLVFTSNAETLEYSNDGGESWTPLTTEEFDAPEEPNKLLVRTKSTGTQGSADYISPSEPIEVPFTEANVGTRPVIKISINFGDISTEVPDTSGETIVIKADESYSDFTWFIDGKAISQNWASANGSTLALTKSGMQTGTYTVTVTAKKNDVTYSTSLSVIKE